MSWAERFEQEEDWQAVLDEFFLQWYDVNLDPAKKVDRIFSVPVKPGAASNKFPSYLVDYKIDDKISKTSRVYLELYKDKDNNKLGWAYTTRAEIIVYLAVPDTIYMVEPEAIWDNVQKWRKGTEVLTKRGSSGILVAEKEFAKVCKTVRRLT